MRKITPHSRFSKTSSTRNKGNEKDGTIDSLRSSIEIHERNDGTIQIEEILAP